MSALNYPRHLSVPADPAEVAISRDDLQSVLSAVETAYEGAWHYSDIGKISFGPFEGLPQALRILRRHRDEVAA